MNDSSTASRQIQIEAIRQSISTGDLKAQQIHDVMLAEITAELTKPQEEVDIDYVNACQTLLMELNSPRAAVTPSHYEQNLTAVRKKFQPRFSFAPHTIWGRFATVLCLIVLITTAGLLMPEGWIITRQSEDEGQYIMQGIETPAGLRSVAEALHTINHLGQFRTTNWAEAVTLLGGVPEVPRWLPSKWSIYEYIIDSTEIYVRFSVTYVHENDSESLYYEETTYFSVEDINQVVEQNHKGNILKLPDGTPIYITNNFEHASATWTRGNTVYFLNGTVAEDVLIRIITSVQ